ncbi:hypothetical protein NEUTE1DRAFT_127148 [Neurospora tetrasperma FGSC 2508]|uniref:RNA helicase n=1 Tax=Neurospora tetrasperma (strain FGSC 2508 / ATCC MYA-4615 / P0657) TaxID=510951 RepID=F8MB56_NEUT8|nr:uncharacterized protein NEUTE1DRAFT_127148 [Neurospora tetrasperma FGSC 2508]EGO60221.1 hypothetical protein NEUTE1DRAFT_127148 [Neurospora tetrasperma FGSC 2508]EGZ75819.1 hypothetical protein NEUTE2DRAFT_148857 [Neurospora tetrasperma FGSC 2509]
MASKRYAFVPMDDEPAAPSKSDRKDRDRDSKRDRKRDRSRSPRRHKSRRPDDSDSTRRRSRSRSPRKDDSRSDSRRDREDPKMSDLRLKSRYDYLKKREAEKLALLRKQVAEETAELRSGVRLSEKEKAEFARNREILRLAEERARIDDYQDGYRLPDQYGTDTKKKEEALYQRHVERDEYGNEKMVTEYDEWEREQTVKAKAQIASRGEREDGGEYDFLLDEDAINFVRDAAAKFIQPTDGLTPEQRILKEKIEAAERAAKSIQEVRKSLPVYAYRDAFLDAIKDPVGTTGQSTLAVVPCSRAAANQRMGRAGRVRPGKCFRLYTKFAYLSEMDESPTPEIQRTSLSSVVLQLKALGIEDLLSFDFLDPPPTELLIKSLNMLYALGALNSAGQLTRVGRQMGEFPAEPMLAKALIAATAEGCVDEMLTIVSMLGEVATLFFRPKDKKVHADSARARFTVKDGGDHLTLLNVYNQWVDADYSPIWAKENFLTQRSLTRARDVRDQLAKLCDRVLEGSTSTCGGVSNMQPILRALTAAFFLNAARLNRGGDGYRTLKNNMTVYVHPSSVVKGMDPPPKVIIYHELVVTTKEFVRSVIPIDPKWLTEFGGHYYDAKDVESMTVKKLPKERKY